MRCPNMKTKLKTAISVNAEKWKDFEASLAWFRETNKSRVIEEMVDAFNEMAQTAKKQGVKRMPHLVFKLMD